MIERKPTERMLKAVTFCNRWLYLDDIEFKGNIDSFHEVSDFLSRYLDDAKLYAQAAMINRELSDNMIYKD